MWNKVRTLAVSVFALAWWGILYPELCFTEDTFEQVVTVEELSLIHISEPTRLL